MQVRYRRPYLRLDNVFPWRASYVAYVAYVVCKAGGACQLANDRPSLRPLDAISGFRSREQGRESMEH